MVDDERGKHDDLSFGAKDADDLEHVDETNNDHSHSHSHVKNLDKGLLLAAANLAWSL